MSRAKYEISTTLFALSIFCRCIGGGAHRQGSLSNQTLGTSGPGGRAELISQVHLTGTEGIDELATNN